MEKISIDSKKSNKNILTKMDGCAEKKTEEEGKEEEMDEDADLDLEAVIKELESEIIEREKCLKKSYS